MSGSLKCASSEDKTGCWIFERLFCSWFYVSQNKTTKVCFLMDEMLLSSSLYVMTGALHHRFPLQISNISFNSKTTFMVKHLPRNMPIVPIFNISYYFDILQSISQPPLINLCILISVNSVISNLFPIRWHYGSSLRAIQFWDMQPHTDNKCPLPFEIALCLIEVELNC